MLALPIFKIHPSSIHSIVAGLGDRLTEKQQTELDKLEAKGLLTFNQKLRRDELIEKRDAKPELSAGAKTFCEEWLKSHIYYETYEFTSKYTDKGNECEPEALQMIADRQGYGMLIKNEEVFENEYMIGTPDALTKTMVEEAKSPYSSKTFPLFEKELHVKANYWQVQGYMDLTGRAKSAVNYCLINAPASMLMTETYYRARAKGIIDIDMEFEAEVERNLTYDDVPIELRHKRWEFDRNEKDIQTIYLAVRLCREYIKSLIPPTVKVTLHDPITNVTIHETI